MKTIFLFIICIAFGALTFHYYRKLEALKKYEFENRTSGGVIEFNTYEGAKKHERLKWWYSMRMKGSLFGFIFFLFAAWVS